MVFFSSAVHVNDLLFFKVLRFSEFFAVPSFLFHDRWRGFQKRGLASAGYDSVGRQLLILYSNQAALQCRIKMAEIII